MPRRKRRNALAKAKDAVTSKFTDMTKIEEAIGKLSGDAKTKAMEKWTAFKKKRLDEFKTAPMDKVKEMGDKLATMYADLKKTVGL